MSESPSTHTHDTLDEGQALRFLVKAWALLAASLDYKQTLASIAQLAVPRLADFVVIDLLQPDRTVRREHTVHVDPEKRAALDDFGRSPRIGPEDRSSPTAHVLASGEPVFLPELPDDLSGVSFDPDQLRLIRRLGVRTQDEIDRERYGLKAIRGDFAVLPPSNSPAAHRAAAAWEAVCA